MRLVNRLMKLEAKQQESDVRCYPLPYFYGRVVQPEPLKPGQTLSDFYNQLNKEVLHG